jgi:hypothetical protein
MIGAVENGLRSRSWARAACQVAVNATCVALVSACGSGGGTAGGGGTGGSGGSGTSAPAPLQHILFVGDSFTHGRYTPVRPFNSGGTEGDVGSDLVVDENFGASGARAEVIEPGPYGGIPGIFAEFAVESKLAYDVHIEAISETSLQGNDAAASSVIDQAKWNAVVLQELSTRPLPVSLTGDSTSDPQNFCQSVQTIEAGVHGAAAAASVYLYETWPTADIAQQLSGSTSAAGFDTSYAANLTLLGNSYHNVYYSAAAHDGAIAGVAPAGEAWVRAWAEGIANSNPFTGTSTLPSLWYGLNATNDPVITEPDYLHPSIYGAYLSALVLFQQITGTDVRQLGANELAAAQLGVTGDVVTQLQQVAWEAVTQESSAPVNQSVDPCSEPH